MNLPELCIKRPVLASVLNLIIVLLGVIAFSRLDVKEYPNIDFPTVSVDTSLAGASPEIMETQVTNIIEDAVSGIEGIDVLSSSTSFGSSRVNVNFKLGVDINQAVNDVRDKVSRVIDSMPEDIDGPTISKEDNESNPIIWISFYSDKYNMLEITDYVDRFVTDQLKRVDGVANAQIFGDQQYTMRIYPDIVKMTSLKVSVNEIVSALRNQNKEFPSGSIKGTDKEFTVVVNSDINKVSEFMNLIIRKSENNLIKLKDIASIELTSADLRTYTRYKGKNSMAIGIVKQSTANPIDISDGIKRKIEELKVSFPEGLDFAIAYDSSIFIKKSIFSVQKTIIEAVLLVFFIIYFFLRNFRTCFIPLITIPVSLIGVFFLMNLNHFSINIITLLAMVLAVGLVVDDAIVMLENIYRYVEKGLKPIDAAITGSKEIAFAIISMTLTLAAVFLPIGFLGGVTGKIFIEFAWTLALAVLISGFVSLTLSPMMASKLLREKERHSNFDLKCEAFINKGIDLYTKALDFALKTKRYIILAAIIFASVSIILFKFIPKELAPTEDQGAFYVAYEAPTGVGLEYTDKYAKQIEAIYKTVPEINGYFTLVRAGGGFSYATLLPWEERKRTQMEIVGNVSGPMFGLIGVNAFAFNLPSIVGGGSISNYSLVLKSGLSYEEIEKMSQKLLEELKKNPNFSNIESDLKIDSPKIEININRDKAGIYGVDIADIGFALQALIGGFEPNKFNMNNKLYPVQVTLPFVQRLTPQVLDAIYVPNAEKQMIKLSSLVDSVYTVEPSELRHYNRYRAVKITGSIEKSYGLDDAVAFTKEIVSKVTNDPSTSFEFSGVLREYTRSSGDLYFSFILALLFIYLVLSAQFESFVDPFIIILSVPLSISGALISLYFSGSSMNIYSQIGMVTLIGLVTKNAILIVEFSNQMMEKGLSTLDAVKEACLLRIRPIAMTTLATILGAAPLALASGPGSQARHAIGIVIVGGLLFGTLFTLFVIPVAFVLIKGRKAPV